MAEEKGKGRIRYTRIFILILAFYTAAMLFLAIPRIPGTLRKLRFQEHVRMYEGNTEEYAVIPVVLSTSSSFAISERTIERKGRDDLHLAVEALLLDGSGEELEEGLVSYIPDGVRLLGIAEKDGYVFIDLSKEMKDAGRRAFEEVRRTLALSEGPVQVSFMIEGRPVSE